jgi:hypothetical protein
MGSVSLRIVLFCVVYVAATTLRDQRDLPCSGVLFQIVHTVGVVIVWVSSSGTVVLGEWDQCAAIDLVSRYRDGCHRGHPSGFGASILYGLGWLKGDAVVSRRVFETFIPTNPRMSVSYASGVYG